MQSKLQWDAAPAYTVVTRAFEFHPNTLSYLKEYEIIFLSVILLYKL